MQPTLLLTLVRFVAQRTDLCAVRRYLALGALGIGMSAAGLVAQAVERPIAFDDAGHMRLLTPELVRRLPLGPSSWPVRDAFVDARLYATAEEQRVLVVQHADGWYERHPLGGAAFARLQDAIQAGVRRRGTVVTEEGSSVIVDSPTRAFIGAQKTIASIVYAPAAVVLVGNGTSSAAACAAVAGGSFFFLSELTDRLHVTRAQGSLATDASTRGVAMTVLALQAANVTTARPTAVGILAGGIAGTIVAHHRGREFSEGAVAAAGRISTMAAVVTAGALAAAEALDTPRSSRKGLIPVVATMAAGWGLGPRYPRSASYGITAADMRLLETGGWLGAAVSATPTLAAEHQDNRLVLGAATVGYLTGAFVGDRVFARPVDHSASDLLSLTLAMGAGATFSRLVPIVSGSDNAALVIGSIAGGAIAGAVYQEHRIRARIRNNRSGRGTAGDSARARGWDVQFSAFDALTATAKAPGTHRNVRVEF